jgi:hypothetical protein
MTAELRGEVRRDLLVRWATSTRTGGANPSSLHYRICEGCCKQRSAFNSNRVRTSIMVIPSRRQCKPYLHPPISFCHSKFKASFTYERTWFSYLERPGLRIKSTEPRSLLSRCRGRWIDMGLTCGCVWSDSKLNYIADRDNPKRIHMNKLIQVTSERRETSKRSVQGPACTSNHFFNPFAGSCDFLCFSRTTRSTPKYITTPFRDPVTKFLLLGNE